MRKQLAPRPVREHRHGSSVPMRRYEAGDGLFFILRKDGSVQIELLVPGADDTPIFYEAYFNRQAWDRIIVGMAVAKVSK